MPARRSFWPAGSSHTGTTATWSFSILRDREGLTQLVFDPEVRPDAHRLARTVRCEWVIVASGTVRPRGEGLENPKLATGQIEVIVDQFEVLNMAKTPPFETDGESKTNEETRLVYRYIDLRRPEMQQRLKTRHRVTTLVREYFDENGFWEIETPMLGKSTPEGARDFLVPSRLVQERVLRPAAVAAAFQADPDDERHGQVLPDRPLLPR